MKKKCAAYSCQKSTVVAWTGLVRGRRVRNNLGAGRWFKAHRWNENRERKGKNVYQ